MKTNKLKVHNVKSKIIRMLQDKAPDSIRINRLYEIFNKMGYSTGDIEKAIDDLIKEKKIIRETPQVSQHLPRDIKLETEKREYIKLKDSTGIAIEASRMVGDSSVIKFLPYTKLSASELNEVVDVLADEIVELNDNFDKKIQEETSKIYAQMITIFGVFVSIFAIIVISTDKMLRFSPDVLSNNDLWSLFLKSAALFLPVGIVIGLLVFIVLRNTRK